MKGKEHSLMEEAGAETWKPYRAAEPAEGPYPPKQNY